VGKDENGRIGWYCSEEAQKKNGPQLKVNREPSEFSD
jgi:hypothetical protein